MVNVSDYLTLLVVLAMLGLFVQEVVHARANTDWRPFWLEVAALAAFAAFLNWLFGFPFPENAQAKGPGEDFALVTMLLFCMLVGMLAQVFYQHFSLPRKKRIHKKIDWGQFFAPACASPIVFIPLMVTLQNSNIDFKAMTAPKMMIFFVAFQNGFFWKVLFDRKQKELETAP